MDRPSVSHGYQLAQHIARMHKLLDEYKDKTLTPYRHHKLQRRFQYVVRMMHKALDSDPPEESKP